MSLTNPNKVITEERLSEFYGQILPYLGGMPEVLANKFDKANNTGDYSSDADGGITPELIVGQSLSESGAENVPVYQRAMWLHTGTTTDSSGNYSGQRALGCEVANVVKVNGMWAWTGGQTPIDNIENGVWIPRYDYEVANKRNNVCVWSKSANRWFWIIVQYTKHNDTPIEVGNDTDYSTTEKIVGTWTDGKPLYQKTFNDTTPSTADTNKVIASIGSVDLKKIDGTIAGAVAINYYGGANYYSRCFKDNSSGNLYLLVKGYLNMRCSITIQYTKTTD